MSTHEVPVIRITEVRKHPNADSLDIIPIGGWQVVSRSGQFRPGDLAVYIQPDYVVPTAQPEFSFLAKPGKDTHRLKAIRLRGELSFGLLIPFKPEYAAYGYQAGDNIIDFLAITRYEPPQSRPRPADQISPHDVPKLPIPRFELENYNNFPEWIIPGEHVVMTEKIHGANARYVFHNGTFFVGSRGRWLKPDGDHAWARACTPAMREWCEAHPDHVLFGEIYGAVQSLKYGIGERGEVAFMAFSVFDAVHGTFWSLGDVMALDGFINVVPLVYSGPFNPDLLARAEDDTRVTTAKAGHMSEGLVIVPIKERRAPDGTRVALKYISQRYWLGNES